MQLKNTAELFYSSCTTVVQLKNKSAKSFCVELLKSHWNVDRTSRAGLKEGLKVRDRTRNVHQRWHVDSFTLNF